MVKETQDLLRLHLQVLAEAVIAADSEKGGTWPRQAKLGGESRTIDPGNITAIISRLIVD